MQKPGKTACSGSSIDSCGSDSSIKIHTIKHPKNVPIEAKQNAAKNANHSRVSITLILR